MNWCMVNHVTSRNDLIFFFKVEGEGHGPWDNLENALSEFESASQLIVDFWEAVNKILK